MLPADRAEAQAEDLVDAQAGEQPQQRDRPDELERIPRRARPAVACGQVVGGRGSARPTSAWPRCRRRSRAGPGRSALAIDRGSANARRGSKRRSIHSHSCRSQKNAPQRPDVLRLASSAQRLAVSGRASRRCSALARSSPTRSAGRPPRPTPPRVRASSRGSARSGCSAASHRPALISM